MSDMYFKSLPDKSTPLIPSNLDKLNDIKVSPTEPTTNEKVWVQKGKNLFNKNGLILANKRLDSGNSSVYTQADCFTSDYIEILPNQDYSLQGINAYHIYNENKEKITQNFYDGDNNDIITSSSNAKYLRISTWDINQAMVSQGSTPTEYEEYVEPKIYLKNDNGVYEPFLKKSEINKVNYSTEEQVIGTWIDGRNIYQQTIIINNETLPSNSDGTIYEKNIKDISNNDIVFIKRTYIECASNSSSVYTSKFMGDFADRTDYTAVRGFANNLLLQTTNSPYIKKACIVIEYTKTTDN